MRCDEVSELLSDFLDGELADTESRSIESHLSSCMTCSSSFNELQEVVGAAGRLPKEVEPGRDLWPGITAKIEADQTNSVLRFPSPSASSHWFQLAAAMALLILGLWMASSRQVELPRPQAVAEDTGSSQSLAEQAERAHSEDGVLLAKSDLLSSIERKRGILDDQTLSAVEADMRLLEEAIGQLRSALVEQPDNRKLRLALAARYQQEVRVLQRVSRV